MKKLTVKSKFRLGAAVILFLFCTLVAVVAYTYLEDLVTQTVYKETDIFVATADATRIYVKDVLRPEVSKLVAADAFIPQAMSTSYVGREVMARLQKEFPEFKYKRAAGNPMNPVNLADEFEVGMLKWFDENRDRKEWYGLIQKGSRSYYTRLRAIYAEAECLVCHGDPKTAPAAMKEIYGTKGGYYYNEGDVVAADTVYIPVDVTLSRIKETAWMVFLMAGVCLFILFGLFSLLFNRTAVLELKGLVSRFRGIADIKDPDAVPPELTAGDEIEQLKTAFEMAADDLKQAHDELKASETKYRLLFETSQDAILIFDADTRIREINPSGVKLFGLKNREEALSAETFYQFFWDTRDAEKFNTMVKEKGFVLDMELPMVNRDGNRLEVMISATLRRDGGGEGTLIYGILRDVTGKRRLERNLAQTEKLASIGQLAAGVAHEINNPLGVIKCYANLIAKELSPASASMGDVEVIRKHTDQCKSVVESLLNFARMSEPKKQSTDLHNVIEDVFFVLENQMLKDGISVERQFMDNSPRLTVDANQIKQVFMNLLMNAFQAMAGGGRITVKTAMNPVARVLTVSIADSGPGIPEKIIDRIFDPFFTTKETGRGTGLGLAVSYGIIKKHGGDIVVESRMGEGTVFILQLPLDEGENE
jgi:two-component system, NtrC family, sensor kinase